MARIRPCSLRCGGIAVFALVVVFNCVLSLHEWAGHEAYRIAPAPTRVRRNPVRIHQSSQSPLPPSSQPPSPTQTPTPSIILSDTPTPSISLTHTPTPSHSPSASPNHAILISLLFNESPNWLQTWLTQAASALQVPYCIVVATSSTANMTLLSQVVDRHNQLEGGCAVLTAPAPRHKVGYDLLRGHITNLQFAFSGALPPFARSAPERQDNSFTHVTLLASNVGFIRKITAQFIDNAVERGRKSYPYEKCHGDCGTPEGFLGPNGWWYYAPAVVKDAQFWEAVAAAGNPDVVQSQWEGIFAPRFAMEAMLHAFTDASSPWTKLIAAKPFGVEGPYPVEELLLHVVPHTAGVADHFRVIVHVFWEIPFLQPNPEDIWKVKCEEFDVAGIKRLTRESSHHILRYCRALVERDGQDICSLIDAQDNK